MDDEGESQKPLSEMAPAFGYFWAAVNIGIALLIAFHLAGINKLETLAGPFFLAALALTLFMVGGFLLLVASANAARGGAPQSAEERLMFERASAIIGFVVLGFIAFGCTTVAVYAWLPEQARAFSGGFSGSVWEHRVVWALGALVFDFVFVFAVVHTLRGGP